MRSPKKKKSRGPGYFLSILRYKTIIFEGSDQILDHLSCGVHVFYVPQVCLKTKKRAKMANFAVFAPCPQARAGTCQIFIYPTL